MERCYHGPFGKAPRHLRFRRAAMSFMRWQLRRGVRLVDYGVIVPRLQQLYEWSAHELAAPGLLDFVRDGAMTYAWPIQDRAPTIHPLKGTEGQHEPFRRTVGGLVGAG